MCVLTIPEVWNRIFEMREDDDNVVRSIVLHSFTSGSLHGRRNEVVKAIEKLCDDPEPKIRRRARRVITEFRRGGRILEF